MLYTWWNPFNTRLIYVPKRRGTKQQQQQQPQRANVNTIVLKFFTNAFNCNNGIQLIYIVAMFVGAVCPIGRLDDSAIPITAIPSEWKAKISARKKKQNANSVRSRTANAIQAIHLMNM